MPARHVEILAYFWRETLTFGSWSIASLSAGMLPVLLAFYFLFRAQVDRAHVPAQTAAITMLGAQVLGYYAIYLITPYDLTWHLSNSITRVFLQVFPLLLFLVLSASIPIESVLHSKSAVLQGAENAAGN